MCVCVGSSVSVRVCILQFAKTARERERERGGGDWGKGGGLRSAGQRVPPPVVKQGAVNSPGGAWCAL